MSSNHNESPTPVGRHCLKSCGMRRLTTFHEKSLATYLDEHELGHALALSVATIGLCAIRRPWLLQQRARLYGRKLLRCVRTSSTSGCLVGFDGFDAWGVWEACIYAPCPKIGLLLRFPLTSCRYCLGESLFRAPSF